MGQMSDREATDITEVPHAAKEKPRNRCGYGVFCGAAGQIRTADLILTN